MDAELKRMLTEQRADPNYLLCRHGEKDWNGGDPECAFDKEGKFREDNWNCFLMSKVRCLMGQRWFGSREDTMPGYFWWDEDQNYGVLYIRSWINRKEIDSYLNGAFVLLDWYKSRGRTESFRILQGDTIRQGTEEDAQEIVRLYTETIAKAYEDDEEEEEMPVDDVKLFMGMLMDLPLEEKKRLAERLNEVIETGGD